tara:strand:- start:145 stop:681 length:537 start_codon:yes stop_codon:yes gene_type:complete
MSIKINKTNNIQFLTIFLLCFFIVQCTSLEIIPNESDIFQDSMKAKGNDTSHIKAMSLSDRLFGIFEGESGTSFNKSITFEVVLDQFSIMPLLSVDRVGGVIITDWYSTSSNTNERVKFNIIIKDDNMKSESIDIVMFKQNYNGTSWVQTSVDTETTNKIKNVILEKSKKFKTTLKLS